MTGDDLLDALVNMPMQFWACPDETHRRTGLVDWVGNIAHCREPGCGRTSADPLVFEVDVPMLLPPKARTQQPCEPLNANWRLHYHDRARRTRIIRDGVLVAARAARIPKGRHLTVTLHYQPGDNRRRDEDNLFPTLKAACDALARGPRRDWVGLELVPDDTSAHMTKVAPIIHLGRGVRRLWLTVEVQR